MRKPRRRRTQLQAQALGATEKALGTNPRVLGTNSRAKARNKWASRNWKRKRRLTRKGDER
jgi:hypothetical protein